MTAFALPAQGEVVFLFDVLSPFSFLASLRVNQKADQFGLKVRWQPVFLGGLLKGSDNTPAILSNSVNKIRWTQRDVLLQAEAQGAKVTWPAVFPQNSMHAMRAIVAIEDPAELQRAVRVGFEHIWVRGGSLEDLPALGAAFSASGLDGNAILQRGTTDAAKAKLRAVSDQAVELGAFGVPDFLVRDAHGEPELFFGNDRMHFAMLRAAGRPLDMA